MVYSGQGDYPRKQTGKRGKKAAGVVSILAVPSFQDSRKNP
jgi:hypothetical protein